MSNRARSRARAELSFCAVPSNTQLDKYCHLLSEAVPSSLRSRSSWCPGQDRSEHLRTGRGGATLCVGYSLAWALAATPHRQVRKLRLPGGQRISALPRAVGQITNPSRWTEVPPLPGAASPWATGEGVGDPASSACRHLQAQGRPISFPDSDSFPRPLGEVI